MQSHLTHVGFCLMPEGHSVNSSASKTRESSCRSSWTNCEAHALFVIERARADIAYAPHCFLVLLERKEHLQSCVNYKLSMGKRLDCSEVAKRQQFVSADK